MNQTRPYSGKYSDPFGSAQTPVAQPAAEYHGRNVESMDFIADGVAGGNGRHKNAFQRARNHSGMVRILRIAFPLIAIVMIAIIGGAYYWSKAGLPSLAIESAALFDGRMVMKNPALKGLDKENRPYVLTAEEAIQDINNPSQIELVRIDANVPMDDGLFAQITAGMGFYDSTAKTLRLDGEVDVVTDNGMTIRLQEADIDMGAGTLVTNNPVSMTSRQAKISADRLNIEGNGELIIFETHVKMTLYPDRLENAKSVAR